MDCALGSPPDCGVPRDAHIELRFDRYLAPATAIRQSIKLYTGSEDLGLFVQPEYDLVERVLVYRLPAGAHFEPGVRYTVELLSAREADDFGFRAFDGAPLGEGPVPLKFDFRTREEEPPEAPPVAPPPTCADALAEFKAAGCAGQACHNPAGTPGVCPPGEGKVSDDDCVAVPRMGLDLSSPAGLFATAIARVAHQADTGAKTGVPLANPPRVGVAMPVIDPGRPETSYLLYKLLRKSRNFENTAIGCTSIHRVALPEGVCPQPSADESARLREWFVRGEPMPLAENQADLRLIQRWIRSGAKCP